MMKITPEEQVYIDTEQIEPGDPNQAVFKDDDGDFHFIQIYPENKDDWAYACIPDLYHADSSGWSVRGQLGGILAELNGILEIDRETRTAILNWIKQRKAGTAAKPVVKPVEEVAIAKETTMERVDNVYVQLSSSETRSYVTEYCKIFVNGKQVGSGYYKWQGRDWQSYDYQTAMKHALQSMGQDDLAQQLNDGLDTNAAKDLIVNALMTSQPAVETVTPKRKVIASIVESLIEPAPWMPRAEDPSNKKKVTTESAAPGMIAEATTNLLLQIIDRLAPDILPDGEPELLYDNTSVFVCGLNVVDEPDTDEIIRQIQGLGFSLSDSDNPAYKVWLVFSKLHTRLAGRTVDLSIQIEIYHDGDNDTNLIYLGAYEDLENDIQIEE